MRIISTVPSQTELLYDLGLSDEVVGITKFCVHPDSWFRSKTRIGGTKNLHIEKIIELHPDLIIANKEENTKEQIETLSKHCKVFVSEIKTVEDNLGLITQIGQLTKKVSEAKVLRDKFQLAINSFTHAPSLNVVYLIWKDPLMVAGGDTYINSTLELCGFKNAFKSYNRYPETSIEELQTKDLDLVFLSSEPFPFKEKDQVEFSNFFPDARVTIVDGEAFSWYGSRLIKVLPYLRDIISRF